MAGKNDKRKNLSSTKGRRQERAITVASILYGQKNKKGALGKSTETQVPWIRMQGKWLEQAGFDIRRRVRVRVMTGCLVLTAEDA